MVSISKTTLALTGSGLAATLIFGGLATPANAADDHSNSTASHVGVVDQTDGGHVRFDVNGTVAVDPRMETVFSHVTVRDGEVYLDFAAVTGFTSAYLMLFVRGLRSKKDYNAS